MKSLDIMIIWMNYETGNEGICVNWNIWKWSSNFGDSSLKEKSSQHIVSHPGISLEGIPLVEWCFLFQLTYSVWETKFLEHSPKKRCSYMFYTRYHLPRPIFYSPSSKCTRIGKRVSFPHRYCSSFVRFIFWNHIFSHQHIKFLLKYKKYCFDH